MSDVYGDTGMLTAVAPVSDHAAPPHGTQAPGAGSEGREPGAGAGGGGQAPDTGAGTAVLRIRRGPGLSLQWRPGRRPAPPRGHR